MREIVLDTETTGLDPASGHRLVEIACVEILNLVPTGDTFHVYLNPERDIPQEAFKIHGLSADFLRSKPLFAEIASAFIEFIGDSRLIIHNAEFDMRFINFELARAGMRVIGMENVFDTLSFARKKHPGASNSLDALCSRYKVNNSKRTKHGALLDSELLAKVYVELMGGLQTKLVLGSAKVANAVTVSKALGVRVAGLAANLNAADMSQHASFLADMPTEPIWGEYLKPL